MAELPKNSAFVAPCVRRVSGALLIVIAALLTVRHAEAQKKEPSKRLRALALVEVPIPAAAAPTLAKTPAKPSATTSVILVPITLLDHGTFFDASIYQATPVPMALESGTVYEAQHSGVPSGYVTVQGAGKPLDSGSWIARGKWQPPPVAHTSSPGTKSKSPMEDERPRLTRGSNSTESAAAAPTSAVAPPAVSAADEAASIAAAQAAEANDPNRPRLRRGESAEITTVSDKDFFASLPSPKKLTSNAKNMMAAPVYQVAISDSAAYETRSYLFPWTPSEQAAMTQAVTAMAQQRVLTYLKTRGAKPPAASSVLQDVQMRAFDLFGNNDAEMVLSARQPLALASASRPRSHAGAKAVSSAPLQNVYITLVVMQDLNGDMHTLFASVTDDEHLDVEGRMELIDAVDAEGNGRAELLFRRFTTDSQSFELYRYASDRLWLLFDSARGAQP